MTASLRQLPSIDTLFPGEMGGLARDPLKAELLDMFWPECFEDSRGQVVMAESDAADLEALFQMFGVPLPVHETPLRQLSYAYDVFGISLAHWVSYKLRHPEGFAEFLHDWPSAWVRYIEAVAAGQLDQVCALAAQLQPLSAACKFPPGVVVQRR